MVLNVVDDNLMAMAGGETSAQPALEQSTQSTVAQPSIDLATHQRAAHLTARPLKHTCTQMPTMQAAPSGGPSPQPPTSPPPTRQKPTRRQNTALPSHSHKRKRAQPQLPSLTISTFNVVSFREDKVRLHPTLWRSLLCSDVVLLQETASDDPDDFTFLDPSLTPILSCHSSKSPGAGMACIVNADTNAVPVEDRTCFQWFMLTKHSLPSHVSPQIFLCNVHIPPDTSPSYSAAQRDLIWDELTQTALAYQQRGHVIMAGDFNVSTSPFRNTQPYNHRKLRELMTALQFVNLTETRKCNRPSHRSRAHGSLSRLDHVICSRELAQVCTLYRTRSIGSIPTSMSDHAPVTCTFTFRERTHHDPRTSHGTTPLFHWRPDRSDMYARAFAARTDDITSISSSAIAGDIDTADAKLVTLMQQIGMQCGMTRQCRQQHATPRRPRHVFRYKMTDAAVRARNNLKCLLHQQPRTDPVVLKAARKAFRTALRRGTTHAAYIKSQQLAANLQQNPRKFWRAWNSTGRGRTPPPIPQRAWRAYYGRKLQADPARDRILQINASDFPNQLSNAACVSLTAPPSMMELLEAALGMRRGTSSGLDGIPLDAFHTASFVDNAGVTQHPVLSAFLPVVEACIRLGRTPDRWRKVRLTSIYKKGDPLRCESYRPISVSVSAYRVFTTLLNHRLTVALESSNVLHDSLYGFRPNRSSMHPPLILKHWVSCAKQARTPIIAGFIDLKSAFDSVSHSALLKALASCGAPQQLVSLVSHMYTNCTAHHHAVVTDTIPIPINKGIRQGCPLSPTLFNLISHVIANAIAKAKLSCPSLHPSFSPCLFYADDITLIATSHDDMKRLLNALAVVCHKVQLKIEPAKTEFMLFNSSAQQRGALPPFHIYGTGVSKHVTSSVVYLGLKLDCTCSSSTMLQHRIEKATSMAHRVRSLIAASQLHHASLLRTVCMSTVVACALYGVEVWGLDIFPSLHAFNNPMQILLNRLFRHGLRLPRRTAGLIVALDTGCPHVHAIGLKRISKGVIRMEKNGPPTARLAVSPDTSLMRVWHSYVTGTLSLYWPTLSHPFPSSVAKAAQRQIYDTILAPYKSRDVRSVDCENRIISTYIQHVWNGRYTSTHAVYLTPTIPCRDYRWWMRVRTLTFPAPAYTRHFSASRSSLCTLGCTNALGDLLHYFTECPYARIACPSPSDMPTQSMGFFQEDIDPHVAARQATSLCTTLRQLGVAEP